jgi:hypothetical protein
LKTLTTSSLACTPEDMFAAVLARAKKQDKAETCVTFPFVHNRYYLIAN